MMDMEFTTRDITCCLESANFDFVESLRLLFAGADESRRSYEREALRFDRHLDRTFCKKPMPLPRNAEQQYITRLQEIHPTRNFEVFDLGMKASGSINACFWLSFAAGWSRCKYEVNALEESDPEIRELERLRREARDSVSFMRPRRSAEDAVGTLAQQLRDYFCKGQGSIMQTSRAVQRWMPAFAALTPARSSPTPEAYRRSSDRIPWIPNIPRFPAIPAPSFLTSGYSGSFV